MKYRNFKIAIAIMVLMPAVVLAIDVDLSEIGFPVETVEVHGFFSQGYMKSSNNNVYSNSHEGTFNLRDFGVNFSGYITDDIRLAAQFMGYSLGELGKDHVNLHYGYADYSPMDEIGIRLGRLRVPAGLYNETRDIDMLRTSIFLPQSVYPEVYRDFFASVDAGSIYGNFDLNDWGTLSYSAHVGNLVNDEDPASDLPFMYNGSLGATNGYFTGGKSAGAQLVWDTPLDGLKLSWTLRRIDNIYIADWPLTFVAPKLHAEMDNFATQIWSYEYTLGKLIFNGEFCFMRERSNPLASGWYMGLDYELTDKLSIGANYSTYMNEKGGVFYKGTRDDDFRNYEDTISTYCAYDIADNWVVKGQVDFNRGTGRHRATMLPGDEERSILFSFKTSWSF